MSEPKEWRWTPLPPNHNVETTEVLKAALEAQQYLSEQKGVAQSIPNQSIILNTLPLQEAKDSSEIENIVTTNDSIYKANINNDNYIDKATKEVKRYAHALSIGFKLVKDEQLLTIRHIKTIQGALEKNDAGIRKLPGTKLSNPRTSEVVFIPPQQKEIIDSALQNLEEYINDDSLSDVHPLIKMAIIHVQFESIHPFYDGNGRTGRIINTLYLVLKGLLDIPVLYLSRYIVNNKADYYRLLQKVRTDNDWESWILYVLKGVTVTSKQTIRVIKAMGVLMLRYKHEIRNTHTFYSQDLINHLFKHPYSKISYLMEDLDISRPTARKYLEELTHSNLLIKHREGRDNYYINNELLGLLTNV